MGFFLDMTVLWSDGDALGLVTCVVWVGEFVFTQESGIRLGVIACCDVRPHMSFVRLISSVLALP